jgi:16S rRNA U516 pseudouridylate synthase RsuA-like enzyme
MQPQDHIEKLYCARVKQIFSEHAVDEIPKDVFLNDVILTNIKTHLNKPNLQGILTDRKYIRVMSGNWLRTPALMDAVFSEGTVLQSLLCSLFLYSAFE